MKCYRWLIQITTMTTARMITAGIRIPTKENAIMIAPLLVVIVIPAQGAGGIVEIVFDAALGTGFLR